MTVRTAWRRAYQLKRGGLAGRALYHECLTLAGERFLACRLQSHLVSLNYAPTPLAVTVLNRWGSRSGWRSPPMTSPRFETWRRQTSRADALYRRLLAAGRLRLDAGNWVQAII